MSHTSDPGEGETVISTPKSKRTPAPAAAPEADGNGKSDVPVKEKGTLKKNGKKKKKLVKRIIILLVIAAVAAAALYLYFNVFNRPVQMDLSSIYTDYTVNRGDITVSITGSASLAAKDQRTIASSVSGDVLTDTFEENDLVEKDDVLYTVDSSDAASNIESRELSLQQAQTSYKDAQNAVSHLTVTAGVSGLVTAVYTSNGNMVSSDFIVADVVDNSKLLVTVPFSTEDAANISIGQLADVTMETTGTVISGVVSRVSSGTYASSLGALVTDVQITFTNPGALTEGQSATASIGGTYFCSDAGMTEYISTGYIRTKGAGEVTGLGLKVGDYVSAGSTIAWLDNDSVYTSLENARISLRNAEISLESAQKTLEDYEITASISGTVVTKNVSAGDLLDINNMSKLAVIADMSELVFTLAVDELEISSVKLGQRVTIVADAYEDQTYEGVVDNIATIGTTSSGVTNYDVKVVISDYGDLLPGMNVDATIIIEEATDVLMVPVDAVASGNLVLVKTVGVQSAGDAITGPMGETAPDGYAYTEVTLGVSDDDFVEIKSGLSEGDVIGYIPVINDSSGMTGMFFGEGMGSREMVVVQGG